MGKRVMRSNKRTQRRRGSKLKQRKKRSKLLKRTTKRRNSFKKKNTYKRRRTNMKRGGAQWNTTRNQMSNVGKSIVRTIDSYSQQGISTVEGVRKLLGDIKILLRDMKVIKIQKTKKLVCIVNNQASESTLVNPDYRLILNSDCHTGFQKAYHSVRERLPGPYSRSTPSIKIEELLSMNFAEKQSGSVKFYARDIRLV